MTSIADVASHVCQMVCEDQDGVGSMEAHVMLTQTRVGQHPQPVSTPWPAAIVTAERRAGRWIFQTETLAPNGVDADYATGDSSAVHSLCMSLVGSSGVFGVSRVAFVRIYRRGGPYRQEGGVDAPLFVFVCDSPEALESAFGVLRWVNKGGGAASRSLREPPSIPAGGAWSGA